ncbi:MAG: capsular biosynthesis protein, partial [Cyanobacteria bacterium J06641_5]
VMLTGYADAHLLASRTDGLLLVTRVGQTKREALKRMIEQLRLSRTPTIGIAINGDRNTAVDMYAQNRNFRRSSKWSVLEHEEALSN